MTGASFSTMLSTIAHKHVALVMLNSSCSMLPLFLGASKRTVRVDATVEPRVEGELAA